MIGKKCSPPYIGIIGAGFSGICAAIQLQKKMGITSFTIFEKNAEIGGTWFKNVYPGCACDVPSHFYSFSFELNPNWTSNYPSQAEILNKQGHYVAYPPVTLTSNGNYLKTVSAKYNLNSHIKFQHEVKTLTWNENLMKWIVQSVNVSVPNAVEETTVFDIIINGPGPIRIPHIPKELTSFTGPSCHTAEWNSSIDIRDKKVAIIGSGASAVQVIPDIVDIVHTLHCYQRKPPYVVPRSQFTFPNFVKTLFVYVPLLMWIYRCFLYIYNEMTYLVFCPDSIIHKCANVGANLYRKIQLKKNQHLWHDAAPKYRFGCKRIIVSSDYYPTLARKNVRLHTSHIDKIVGQTIYSKDGTEQHIDVLILATGFRVQDYFGPMKIFGKDGEDIGRMWTEVEPRSFYGIFFSATPNHFALLGPNTVLAHSSLIFMIECQVNVIIDAIREMMKRNARAINLKLSAEDEFMDKLKRDMKNTVWGKEDCGSWYANSRGVITILWTDTCTNYWRQTKTVDWSKFDFI